MEKRILGKTGLEVSAVGFGAMTIGGRFGPVDDGESIRALHAAIDCGMNLIDTSNAYGEGHSEELIGKFLKERSDRDGLIIVTKGGNTSVRKAHGWIYDYRPEYITQCLEESLGRLGVEVIDVYLLHNPTVGHMGAQESYALLEEAKSKGKIKHWGVSVNTVEECDLAVSQGMPSVLQMEYNLLTQEAAGSFAKAKEAGVGVISRVPLKRGFLSGKIDESFEFDEDDMRRRILTPENIRRFQGKLQRLREVARQLDISPAGAAIRFCVSHPCVATVIPGVRTEVQARENATCGEPLPEEALRSLLED